MRYLVGFMMFAFLLVGIGLVVAGIWDFIRKFYRMTYFRRTTGSVVRVERERQIGQPDGFRHRQTQYRFFPVIKFTHLTGEEITFKSEIGDGGTSSKYRIGQRLPIVYDVDNRLTPMIASFAGMWLPPILLVVSGFVFIGGAALIFFGFGEKISG